MCHSVPHYTSSLKLLKRGVKDKCGGQNGALNVEATDPCLQAIMLFSVSGSRTETMGDKINAYNMYNQTLHLIKYVMKLTTSKNAKKDIDIR